VGDENYTWQAYLELWFRLAGNEQAIPVREDDHPLFPNIIMFAGVGATVNYEPSSEDMAVLKYGRGKMAAMMTELLGK
ncbi:MAG: hypothetical protein RL143_1233, partial [Pseudomonadota bacterium]